MDETKQISLKQYVLNALSGLFAGGFFVIVWILATTPNPTDITGCITTNFHKIRLCPTDSGYLKLHQVSPLVLEAILASEDSSFFRHRGFDWFELKQSFWLNLSKGTFVRGGSTITQQLAKNVYLGPDKSILRKAKEALLAAQIERLLSKREILERYLNVIELGPDLFGLEKGAYHYFGVHPSDLHLLHAAYITYLMPNPLERYSTLKQRKLTDYGRKRIIEMSHRLYRFKKISANQHLAVLELVDRFPWTDLTAAEKIRLRVPTNEELEVPVAEEVSDDEEEVFVEIIEQPVVPAPQPVVAPPPLPTPIVARPTVPPPAPQPAPIPVPIPVPIPAPILAPPSPEEPVAEEVSPEPEPEPESEPDPLLEDSPTEEETPADSPFGD